MNRSDEIIASLYVERFFSNVPAEWTIDIILAIMPSSAQSYLSLRYQEISWKKCWRPLQQKFLSDVQRGNCMCSRTAWRQGPNWGVLFVQACMSYVEQLTLQAQYNRPHIYCWNIDDIFVCVHNQDHLEQLRSRVQEISRLIITVEMSRNNKLPFL